MFTRQRWIPLLSLALAVLTLSLPAPARATSTQPPTYQFGIDTWVSYACQGFGTYLKWASNTFDGYKSLGANAVGISFPIYSNGLSSSSVYPELDCQTGEYSTPPFALLTDVIKLAEQDGLSVLLRPLVTLVKVPRHEWRGEAEPTNVTAWFASYLRALTPYLELAQSLHVQHFAISTELDSLATRGGFARIVKAAKKLYTGDRVVAYTWTSHYGKQHWAGTSDAIDAYPSVLAPSTSTPTQLLDDWDALLRNNPLYRMPVVASTEAIDEVGILAIDGSYLHPLSWTSQPFDQNIQANWFTAACMFMKEHHMKGIYFWGDWMNTMDGDLLTSPSPAHAIFLQPAAQKAIEACFNS